MDFHNPRLPCFDSRLWIQVDQFLSYICICIGVWLYLCSQTLRGGYSEFLPFLKNKAKRLLVPYCFAMAAWVAPISALLFEWDITKLVQKYLFCINPSQLWFLWMLFWVFVITWPLWKLFSEQKILGAAISLIFYCLGIVGQKLFPNAFCIWTAFMYVPFFYIGIRMRYNRENNNGKILPWWLWLISDLAIWGLYQYVSKVSGVIGLLLGIAVNFLLHVVGAIMAFEVFQQLAQSINWRDSKIFISLSNYSMPMYLFHQQIIYFPIVLLNGKINPYLHGSLNFVIALLGSYLLGWILMRFQGTRILLGECHSVTAHEK